MHLGIQTITWGMTDVDIPQMLEVIRSCGYTGAEFAQAPDALGTPKEFRQMLGGLEFLGLAGGSLPERIKFVTEFEQVAAPSRRPYVYLDEWDEEAEELVRTRDVVFGIHPHMFKPIQTAKDAEDLLSEYTAERVRLLPDTSHLTIAGENLVDVLSRNLGRIDVVHLKDWTPEFGRAYQFYSRGFVGLGEGKVPLTDVLGSLRLKSFSGWLVAEQDAAEDPVESARKNMAWLRKNIRSAAEGASDRG